MRAGWKEMYSFEQEKFEYILQTINSGLGGAVFVYSHRVSRFQFRMSSSAHMEIHDSQAYMPKHLLDLCLLKSQS